MWRLFYHYLVLISPSFSASGKLCFVIVAFACVSLLIFVYDQGRGFVVH